MNKQKANLIMTAGLPKQLPGIMRPEIPQVAMCGRSNVGKSSLINRLCGGKKAKVENRPGVTLTPQWIATSMGLDLMDMPGVLWPRFDDRNTGENLAITGAIKDDVVEIETLAIALCHKLRDQYPALLAARTTSKKFP